MVTPRRQSTSSLIDQLFQESYSFEFHQAVKLLEKLNPQATPLGRSALASHEALILKSRILFSYPASDLYDIAPEKTQNPYPRMIVQVNFMGIAGSNGPLPLPYSEVIAERLKASDRVAADFLDIFNHRLLSLLHRIRRKHWIGLDNAPPEKTRIAQMLTSFLGLRTKGLQDRLAMPDRHLLLYAGLLWQKPPSIAGLKTFIGHYFNCPVHISMFKGGWEKLESAQVTRLGSTFSQLGRGAVLGTRVWNARQRIRIHLGPLEREVFNSFLPHGRNAQKLKDMVRFYLGIHQRFDINLRIKSTGMKRLKLGDQAFLGWNTWLVDQPQDDDQVILNF